MGWLAAVVTIVATGVTLALEPHSRERSRVAKMAASTGFIAVAIVAGAFDSTFGTLVVIGLLLSWTGDLLLTFRSDRAFLLGLVSFLFGHVAYVVAFVVRGQSPGWMIAGVIVTGAAAIVIAPWLLPHLDDAMRIPVIAYMAVISAMLLTAAGTQGSAADWRILMGAALFYVSDIYVARDRFVTPGRINRLTGLPLYYVGQLLLAWSAGG
ncbi:MAG: lysoplasmalogenase [Acidimicrobiia bacterium]|nr:lysoplasmalogenase [Acidimicrobiia bacterium]